MKSDYEKTYVYNQGELEDIQDIARQLPHDLIAILLCKVGQVKLYEMEEEYVAAQEKAFGLTEFMAEQMSGFKKEFGRQGVYFRRKSYKSPLDLKKKKTLKHTRKQLIEANIHMEHLLNTSVSYALTIPEEIVRDGLLDRLGF